MTDPTEVPKWDLRGVKGERWVRICVKHKCAYQDFCPVNGETPLRWWVVKVCSKRIAFLCGYTGIVEIFLTPGEEALYKEYLEEDWSEV